MTSLGPMRSEPSTCPRALRYACAVVCSVAAAGLWAAPNDPLERLLIERGLFEAPAAAAQVSRAEESGLGQRVYNGASGVVVAAMNFLGVPYRRGGNDEEGFDCSGFTRHLFEARLGLVLPRRAEEQAHAPGLVKVPRSELQPGDLVFFNTLRRTFSHVGIYIGEGRFIHAPRPGAQVRLESMQVAYWSKRFTGARRPAGDVMAQIPAMPAAAPEPAAESTLGFPPMY